MLNPFPLSRGLPELAGFSGMEPEYAFLQLHAWVVTFFFQNFVVTWTRVMNLDRFDPA